MKGVKAFHITKKGQFMFQNEAAEVKDKVQEYVKEWLDARGGEESEWKHWGNRSLCGANPSKEVEGEYKEGLHSSGPPSVVHDIVCADGGNKYQKPVKKFDGV